MNILHCCFSKGWGGLEMYPLRLYPFLVENNINIFFAVRAETQLSYNLIAKKYPFLSINWSKSLFHRIYLLIKFIKENQIDLLHCHKSSDLFYAVMAKKFTPIKIVFTEHMGGKRTKKDFYHRWIYRNVSHLFSISNEVKRRNLNALPLDESKISTVHLGLDLKFYQPKLNASEKQTLKKNLSLPLDKLLIGLPGRFSPAKGHITLIKALKIINNQDVAVVFIGGLEQSQGANIPYIEALKAHVIKNNLSSQISFTGFQSDIPAIIESLDIVCIPSYNEAFGLTVIESMAMNTPLVASNAGGIPELIKDEYDGLLFEPKNEHDLAQKLLLLINSTELRNKYAFNALKKVKLNFSQQKHIKTIIKHYENTIYRS